MRFLCDQEEALGSPTMEKSDDKPALDVYEFTWKTGYVCPMDMKDSDVTLKDGKKLSLKQFNHVYKLTVG